MSAFSAYHLSNSGLLFPDSYVSAQLVVTFAMGVGFGAFKETKVGLLGAMSAHITNNVIALFPLLISC